MKTIKLSCVNQGEIVIPGESSTNKDGFSTSGNLADYSAATPEALHKIASKYSRVLRFGKGIKGKNYSLRMAKNDFKKYAI